jgi:Glycosyl transferases group 1
MPDAGTPAGVNGLDLAPGEDFVLVKDAPEMAEAIENLLRDPAKRNRLETAARRRVERDFDWGCDRAVPGQAVPGNVVSAGPEAAQVERIFG